MNGQEKSDPGVVAVKPTNKAGRPGAESVEPRLGTEGNVGQQSTHQRSRYMTLETIAPMSDNPIVILPAVAA